MIFKVGTIFKAAYLWRFFKGYCFILKREFCIKDKAVMLINQSFNAVVFTQQRPLLGTCM